MSNPSQRVVITGLGVVCPLGRELDALWNNLTNLHSGVSKLDCLPENGLDLRFGGQSKCFTGDIENFGPLEKTLQRAIKKNQKVMCREIEMGVAAKWHSLTAVWPIQLHVTPNEPGSFTAAITS